MKYNWSQVGSVVGAVLAVGIGGLGIILGWFQTPDGLGLIMAGLAILGIHSGGVSNPTS